MKTPKDKFINDLNVTKAKRAGANIGEFDLELKLMTLDDADDSAICELYADVDRYITDLLRSGNKKKALEFLNKNKHRFDSDLKEMLTQTIKDNC